VFVLPHRSSTPRVRTLFDDLERWADAPALLGERAVTYAELAERADRTAADLRGDRRRLALVEAAATPEAVAAYIGAMRAGAVVLLAPEGNERALDAFVDRYDPDVTITAAADHTVMHRRSDAAHDLHPDLALLLSTSGSTGSPKLVRLSHENLRSNASAIASYLGIERTDRAMLSLPLHYCYGLSILHSNLASGAAVVLSEASVVDRCFWDRFARWGATSLAGVPHTFELLDRAGFANLDLPTLRYVTQAGGRLQADAVRRYARLGAERGWRFFVMYGQTEATARMAYLPPELAEQRPDAIGVPVPGGSFRIADPDAEGAGELVYSGPNVMLGYATAPEDLAAGRSVDELHTGDLARQADDGLFEIVGRRSRFVKPFGVRVDLDAIESSLADAGIAARCAGDDDGIVVGVDGRASPIGDDELVAMATAPAGLPRHAAHVARFDVLPVLPTGKTDYRAIAAAVTGFDAPTSDVRDCFERLFDGPVADGDSFASLGGDSMTYVEMSIRLEAILGDLPDDWPRRSVASLERQARTAANKAAAEAGSLRSRLASAFRTRRLETNVVLRAVAIVIIVGSHTGAMNLRGGAHVLLAIAGYNLARFRLRPGVDAGLTTAREILISAGRVAVPAVMWIGGLVAITDRYSLANVFLVNSLAGAERWGERWQYWFIEVLVQLLVVTALAMAVPAVRRLDRDHGFALAAGVMCVGLALRFDLLGTSSELRLIHRVDSVFWLFALGWAAHRASTTFQRLLLTGAIAIGVPHYFESGRRETLVFVGLLLLVWVSRVAVPAIAVGAVSVLATSSLYVYLTHWQVYPPLAERSPAMALVVSLGVGVAVAEAVRRLPPLARAARRTTP